MDAALNALEDLKGRFEGMGYGDYELHVVFSWVKDLAPLVIHVHLDQQLTRRVRSLRARARGVQRLEVAGDDPRGGRFATHREAPSGNVPKSVWLQVLRAYSEDCSQEWWSSMSMWRHTKWVSCPSSTRNAWG
ncbi:unnamed protein product [Durusdinium trenchii]|uniref:Uncharacterized protein n=1 Tax=Durusdinium trenchii TaxID=1381693 RepID=A0ABP0Q3K7_9DINO